MDARTGVTVALLSTWRRRFLRKLVSRSSPWCTRQLVVVHGRKGGSGVVVVVVVAVGITITHLCNLVRGHRIGSNHCGVEEYSRKKIGRGRDRGCHRPR